MAIVTLDRVRLVIATPVLSWLAQRVAESEVAS